ncbi:hypothetical protein TRFO_25517 [Tritrichomonas foetus]|uniref:Uncharacterized protein n=1 Tax=Tritrichomonas foetus TaxID=1144522 RepID=A0A1J4KA10_9EUKA|nr:hypothetical protein TRFO_25517 [Tritrichomonas foetus]|eukprot:OHT06486.1 hypothetical protein TRFO_25517 [Tritrichomonas foetus]
MDKEVEFINELYSITDDSTEKVIHLVINSGFLENEFSAGCFFSNIFAFLSFRPQKAKMVAKLLNSLKLWIQVQQQSPSKENLNSHLNSIFSFVFRTYQHDIDIIQKIHYIGFLYDLLQEGFTDFPTLFEHFKTFEIENEVFINFQLLFFIWFMPEIEQFNNFYYQEKESVLFNFSKSPDCSPLIQVIQGFNLEKMKANNWKKLKKLRNSNHFLNFLNNSENNNENNKESNNDDDDINYNERLDPSLFCRCPFLQYSPTIAMVDSFLGSNRFFIKNDEFNFDFMDDNDQPISYFIAASGSIENILYLKEKNVDLKGILQILSLFHHNEVFSKILNENLMITQSSQTNLINYSINTTPSDTLFINNHAIFDNRDEFSIDNDFNLKENHVLNSQVLDNQCLENQSVNTHNFSDQSVNHNFSEILNDSVWRVGTVLHQASVSNNISIFDFCLSKGADFTLSDDEGKLPIHVAAIYNSSLIISRILKINPSLINSQDSNGLTPLMHAALNNSIESAYVLIHFYDDTNDDQINIHDFTGKTALHYAAKVGASRIVEMLISSRNINKNPLDNAKRLPSHFASHFGHSKALEILAKDGSNIIAKSKNGWTPFKFAIGCGHKLCVTILLNYAQIDDADRQELFSFAEDRGRSEIAKMIMK